MSVQELASQRRRNITYGSKPRQTTSAMEPDVSGERASPNTAPEDVECTQQKPPLLASNGSRRTVGSVMTSGAGQQNGALVRPANVHISVKKDETDVFDFPSSDDEVKPWRKKIPSLPTTVARGIKAKKTGQRGARGFPRSDDEWQGARGHAQKQMRLGISNGKGTTTIVSHDVEPGDEPAPRNGLGKRKKSPPLDNVPTTRTVASETTKRLLRSKTSPPEGIPSTGIVASREVVIPRRPLKSTDSQPAKADALNKIFDFDLSDSEDDRANSSRTGGRPSKPTIISTKSRAVSNEVDRPKVRKLRATEAVQHRALPQGRPIPEQAINNTTAMSLPHTVQGFKRSHPTTRSRPNAVAKPSAVLKGISAPAILSRMAEEQSSISGRPSLSPPTMNKDGVVKPRLWNKLLNDPGSHESITDLRFSALRLTTEKKPKLSIARSSSDMTGIGKPKPKRPRLIDTLMKPRNVSEDEESDEKSESDKHDDVSPMEVDGVMESQTSATPQAQSSKARYGDLRSHLAELNEDEMMDVLMEDFAPPPTQPVQNSQKDDLDLESDDDEGVEKRCQAKNVQDLRAAGSKKRLFQELESLISGVEGEAFNSMGSRRSDLLELINKLLDDGMVDTLLIHGLDRQLMATFAKSKDAVFDFLSACCTSLICFRTTQLAVLRGITRSGYPDRLLGLLSLDADISKVVRERQFNMSGIAQKKVVSMADTMRNSPVWSENVPDGLSPRLVSLRAIELLVRRTRELQGDDAILDEDGILHLLSFLGSHQPGKSANDHVTLIFSILESCSIRFSSTTRGAWSTSTLLMLVDHLSAVLSSHQPEHQQTRNLALRLCINLTNNNSRSCDLFGVPTLVSALLTLIVQDFVTITSTATTTTTPTTSLQDATPSQDATLDELILSLGALINLAELSIPARLATLSPTCQPLLSSLARIFSASLDRTTADADADADADAGNSDSLAHSRSNVAYGYLALLLVNVCQEDAVRDEVVLGLGGARLGGLVDRAEEFVAIHQLTDKQVGGEVNAEYTRRLVGMVRKLRDVVMDV
jgi:hypothetical protein